MKKCPQRSGERGTALIMALMVMVVLTLLGIPFLLMGETENRIAENERLSLEAQYAAESGARVVKRWFDHPGQAANVINPPLAAVDRSARLIDDDADPGTPRVTADGSSGLPFYKQDDDALFDKPYRGSLTDSLIGTEDGPDLRIRRGDSTAARDFLDQMSVKLFGGLPSALRRTAIREIEVYGPPERESGGAPVRFGIGTVKVTAGVYEKQPGSSVERALAERIVRFVFNEVPYNNTYLGAAHTCEDMDFPDVMRAYWGLVSAEDDIIVEPEEEKVPASLARVDGYPGTLTKNPLWNEGGHFGDYKAALEAGNVKIDDPWLYMVAGETIYKDGFDANLDQPAPFPDWDGVAPLGDRQLPYQSPPSDPPGPRGSLSYMHHNIDIGCPLYPYETWKRIAQSGGPNVHYFAWVRDDVYQENGTGAETTFRNITDGRSGFYFFDTRDGLPPKDDFTNLAPTIELVGGTWSFRGFLYVNALLMRGENVMGRPVEFRAPGEPYLDVNTNGVIDDGEWINLAYPSTLGGEFHASADDLLGATGLDPVWNARGPAITADANVWGIFHTSGFLNATGNLVFYGSTIAYAGMKNDTPYTGSLQMYWDQSLAGDAWPEPELGLPRVVVTSWEVGL